MIDRVIVHSDNVSLCFDIIDGQLVAMVLGEGENQVEFAPMEQARLRYLLGRADQAGEA